jgi:hypothetical protein
VFGLCIWLYFYFVVCIVIGGCIGLWVQEHCFAPSKVFFETMFQSPSNGLLNYAMCIKLRLFQTCKV